MTDLLRYADPKKGTRLGCRIGNRLFDITERYPSITAWLQSTCGRAAHAIQELETLAFSSPVSFSYPELERPAEPGLPHLLPPVDQQEVWAAGVTYTRSRLARQKEAIDGGDIYARVYTAKRPELFFKALGEKVVGHRQKVGIRADAVWSVPEPELALVLNPALDVVGTTIGNDMSSRDIEGANPLYLPQAKIYTASCALGPVISLQPLAEFPHVGIHLRIDRNGQEVFSGQTDTSMLQRSLKELIAYLGHSANFPYGVVLLTGTGIVPPESFTLLPGDQITISIDQIGELINTVMVV